MFGLKNTQYWMGYPASYADALTMEAKAATLDQVQMKASMAAERSAAIAAGHEPLPRLYSRIGDVGVITIHGALVNTENWMTEALGMSTYPAIQSAAAFAAMDKKVSRVMLDVNSGGGSVSGVETTANMLAQLKAVKPMTTYSDGMMGSAAYWLGSVANKVYVNASTIVGSIGTVAVHTDQSEAFAKAGIKQTVIRSGEFKALGHPAEPLSAKAEAHIQDMVDKSSAIFEAGVAANRGMSLPAVQKVAQGKEYLGADAQAAGLVDGVMALHDVFAAMEKKKPVDNITTPNNNRSQQIRGSTMTRVVLTNEQMALAISAGADEVTLVAANAAAQAAIDAALTPTQITEAELAKVAAKTAEDAATLAAETVAAELAKTEAKDITGVNPLQMEHDFLKTQFAASQTEVMNLKVAGLSAENKYKADNAALVALRAIAVDSANKMTVALGGSVVAMDSLTADAVVALHAEVSTKFCSTFKVGGVASTKLESKEVVKLNAKVSSLEQARLKAATTGGSK